MIKALYGSILVLLPTLTLAGHYDTRMDNLPKVFSASVGSNHHIELNEPDSKSICRCYLNKVTRYYEINPTQPELVQPFHIYLTCIMESDLYRSFPAGNI